MDNLQTVLNSALVLYFLRIGAAAEVKQFTATAPALCFGLELGNLLDNFGGADLSEWMRLDDPSPALFKCIREATEERVLYPTIMLFDQGVVYRRYGSANAALEACIASGLDQSGFEWRFNYQRDKAGDVL